MLLEDINNTDTVEQGQNFVTGYNDSTCMIDTDNAYGYHGDLA